MSTFLKEIISRSEFAHYLFSYASITDKQRKIYNKIGSKIGKSGWTISSNIPLRIPLIINDENWDERKIDEYFIDHFSNNNFINTIDTITHIKENLHDEYKQAFIQLCKCFDAELYIPAILTLMSLLEGCFQDLNNRKETGIGNLVYIRKQKAMDKAEIDIPPTMFCRICAIQNFSSKFYDSVDFENIQKTTRSNRHILIHGRNLNSVTKLDCIRLLSCIDSILNVDYFLLGNAVLKSQTPAP